MLCRIVNTILLDGPCQPNICNTYHPVDNNEELWKNIVLHDCVIVNVNYHHSNY
jgi:hypothetical protein